MDFFNLLTGPELLAVTDSLSPAHRERLYSPTVVLSMFMGQVLEADGSCQKAVDSWAAQRAAEGLSVQSVNTGAYCRARQRLPVEMVSTLARHTGEMLSERALAGWGWRGRCVKLVDGTGILMPDTAANQACYPQPSSQAVGVGSPLARLVAVICLSTGALLDAAMGPHAGKGTSELGLLRQLVSAFFPGDVMLADAFYCNFFLIAALQALGVDVLFAQNGARNTDFRRGEKLGTRDHRVIWPKPKARPEWMSAEDFAGLPDELILREVKVGKKILVTTMLCPRKVCKTALGQLFRQRWNVELDLRAIKNVADGRIELQHSTDEQKRAVGTLSRLQLDPHADGAGRGESRREATSAEFQAHGATMERVARTPPLQSTRRLDRAAVRPDRTIARR